VAANKTAAPAASRSWQEGLVLLQLQLGLAMQVAAGTADSAAMQGAERSSLLLAVSQKAALALQALHLLQQLA
jgi:hypothetical protein